MKKEYKFKEGVKVATFKNYRSGTVDKLIRHNFRIKIPENVNPEFSKYNFYYVNNIIKEKNTNEDGFWELKNEKYKNKEGFKLVNNKRFELLKLIKNELLKQQKDYSKKQKISFENHCEKHNTYIEVLLPNARQEWFEKMGICHFTDIQVWDQFTKTRKMGKLIPESINFTKLNEWVKIEINFMKQWMKNNLKTNIGYLYSTVHMDETTPHVHFGFIPIAKIFSKKLNEERYKLSTNMMFGNIEKMIKFHQYHANYLTKSGYEIEHGEIGGKGSYNAINFRQVKEFERNLLNNEIDNLFDEYKLKKNNIEQFNKIKSIRDDYDALIFEIKQYLKYENNFTDYEINQLTKYLDLTEKIKYYKIITSIPGFRELDLKNMSLIEQEFNEMVFKINPIMQKGYNLIKNLER